MAHETITISEEAYKALARAKAKKEPFTNIILTIVKKREEGMLLDYLTLSATKSRELALAQLWSRLITLLFVLLVDAG